MNFIKQIFKKRKKDDYILRILEDKIVLHDLDGINYSLDLR